MSTRRSHSAMQRSALIVVVGLATACSGGAGDGGGDDDGGATDGDATDGSATDGGVGPSDDPFDPASCTGAPMTRAEAIALFEPGATEVTIGAYVVQMRSRPCNPVTGCGTWDAPTTLLGASLGSLGLDRELRGAIGLAVEDTEITLKLVDQSWDDAGSRCGAVDGATQQCSSYAYVAGQQWGGSGGLFPTWSRVVTATDPAGDDELELGGTLTTTCLRLGETVLGDEVEQEYVVFARLGEPVTPTEPVCPAGQYEATCGGQAGGSKTCCQDGTITCPQSGCDCWAACS